MKDRKDLKADVKTFNKIYGEKGVNITLKRNKVRIKAGLGMEIPIKGYTVGECSNLMKWCDILAAS